MSDAVVAAHGANAIRRGSRSFAVASRLFDRRTRESAVMLYAWCRHCDDVVDGQVLGHGQAADGAGAAARLDALVAETQAALAGEPMADPSFAGLRIVVRRHAIPHRYPLQHLDGFRMDVARRPFATLGDTLDYAYHVAGVVGLMMAHVMGVQDEPTLDRASDLGIAFQLTNIARDIVEDAKAGRVYLPTEWLAEAGVPAGEVASPERREAVAAAAARLLAEAEPYYASAEIGIAALPPRAAWAIAAARGIYRQIGLDVVAKGAGAWDERVSTTALQKLRHVAGGSWAIAPWPPRTTADAPPRTGLYARPA